MPTQLPATCALGAILTRADPRDALVMAPRLASAHPSLASLPPGAIVGTSSVRRSAQVARLYPHLRFANVRGNVGTRLAKLDAAVHPARPDHDDGNANANANVNGDGNSNGNGGEEGSVQYSCLILAAAGLQRLGLGGRITQFLDSKEGGLLHAVGQGALGVEIRAGDERVRGLLGPLRDARTGLACLAERSLLRTLEGGCSVPIGVETEWVGSAAVGGRGSGTLVMRAIVVSLDGTDYVEGERRGEVGSEEQADELGWSLAGDLVAKGAGRILEAINLNRDVSEGQYGA